MFSKNDIWGIVICSAILVVFCSYLHLEDVREREVIQKMDIIIERIDRNTKPKSINRMWVDIIKSLEEIS